MMFVDTHDPMHPVTIAAVAGSLIAPVRIEFSTIGGCVSLGFRSADEMRRFANEIHSALLTHETKEAA